MKYIDIRTCSQPGGECDAPALTLPTLTKNVFCRKDWCTLVLCCDSLGIVMEVWSVGFQLKS